MERDVLRERIAEAYRAITMLTADDGPYIYFPTADEVADAVLAALSGEPAPTGNPDPALMADGYDMTPPPAPTERGE